MTTETKRFTKESEWRNVTRLMTYSADVRMLQLTACEGWVAVYATDEAPYMEAEPVLCWAIVETFDNIPNTDVGGVVQQVTGMVFLENEGITVAEAPNLYAYMRKEEYDADRRKWNEHTPKALTPMMLACQALWGRLDRQGVVGSADEAEGDGNA